MIINNNIQISVKEQYTIGYLYNIYKSIELKLNELNTESNTIKIIVNVVSAFNISICVKNINTNETIKHIILPPIKIVTDNNQMIYMLKSKYFYNIPDLANYIMINLIL